MQEHNLNVSIKTGFIQLMDSKDVPRISGTCVNTLKKQIPKNKNTPNEINFPSENKRI